MSCVPAARLPATMLTVCCVVVLTTWPALGAARSASAPYQPAAPPAAPAVYTTTRPPEALANKQVVLDTTSGTIVVQLFGDRAPNHVGFVLDQVEAGAYDGTTFHRAVPMGIVQGGDPLSTDPAKASLYGTGGLHRLKREPNDRRHVRGAVSAVLVPNRPDSAGAQFFICLVDQPALDGQFTVFGEVVDGLDVAERISQTPLDTEGRLTTRVAITRATVRDTPPPEPVPFSTESPEVLASYRATLATTMGDIVIELRPDAAPGHVRNFLRLAQLGVYDDTAFHRVVPGFAIQAGDLSSRPAPLTQKQRNAVGNVAAELNAIAHEAGVVSMARGDALDSATTSFFICTGPAATLDGKYTAFGRVVSGLDVVRAIEATPVDGETPRTRVAITRVTLTRSTP